MVRVLLVEPGKTGHRPTILRYACKVLKVSNVEYMTETSPEVASNSMAIQDTAARNSCHLVHVLTFDGVFKQWAWSGYRRAYAVPVVATYYLYSNFLHPVRGLIADLMLKQADISAVLVSDEYLGSRWLPAWRRSRLRFLPDPWDPDEFRPISKESAREALGLEPDVATVLMFGELSLRKGVDTMLEALTRLPARAKVKGLFAGRMAPDVRKRHGSRIAELQSRGRLVWRDEFIPEEEIVAYFCAADAVACPYPRYFSVSSNTATRAAAAGRPIIVSSHGFLGRIISEKGIGLTFPAHDSRRLAGCLLEIEKKVGKETLTAMGERARRLAATRTLQQYAKALISTYSAVLGQELAPMEHEKASPRVL